MKSWKISRKKVCANYPLLFLSFFLSVQPFNRPRQKFLLFEMINFSIKAVQMATPLLAGCLHGRLRNQN
jgi:hypothetical protein